MSALLRSYGSGLVALFFACVVGWSLMLILLPQVAMVERAVTPPTRSLDSSIARTLELDARTCINVLERYAEPEPQASDDAGAGGGLAIPSPSQMAVPSPSQMAVPSPSGMAVPSPSGMGVPSATGGSARPYILQCDRTTTGLRLSGRDGEAAFLDQVYDLPALAVAEDQTIAEQIATAERIADLADDLYARLLKIEAEGFNLTLANFAELSQPILIPMTPETRAIEDAQFFNQVFGLMGLRYVEDGEVYARIGLMTLARTLIFAVMATALALVICYPIAFKVALASGPERAKWLFLGLVIPYAIVELMRIYAWTAIIDNQGLLNSLLMWTGAVTEPVQFKRSAFTVFIVIVYTYVLFMVFPMVNVMSTLDRNQIEAARDLGASTWRVHRRVIIPHAKPGIAVGCIATFMLSAGAFSVPRIISRGLQSEWFAQTIYNKFFESENSNIGAAYSFAYTLVCFVLVGLFMYAMRTRLKDFARVQ